MAIKKIEIQNLTHKFDINQPSENEALKGINLSFRPNQITAIIGPSSAGKTVLLQHLNGLLKPTTGKIIIDDFVLSSEQKKVNNIQNLRKKIGFLFQFPEQQLFEETVEKDIIFGPLNFGFEKKKAQAQAHKYLDFLKLPKHYLQKSPFQLSGGEKRKVAIAGIFAYEPQLILVDQLSRGLDVETRQNFLNLLLELKNKLNKTVIFAAHDMDGVLEIADQIVVMQDGRIVLETTPLKLFFDRQKCQELDIQIPKTIDFVQTLSENNFPIKNLQFRTEEELIVSLLKEIENKEKKAR